VAVLLVGLPLTVFSFFGSEWLLGLRRSWDMYSAYAPLVWRVSIVSVLQSILMAFMAHENACSRFRYVKWFVPVLAGEIVLLYCLMGWHVFKPWLPLAVWDAVQGVVEHKLVFAVWMMVGTRAVLVAVAGWCFFRTAEHSNSPSFAEAIEGKRTTKAEGANRESTENGGRDFS
jgi:hypothetical protein